MGEHLDMGLLQNIAEEGRYILGFDMLQFRGKLLVDPGLLGRQIPRVFTNLVERLLVLCIPVGPR